MFATRLLRQMTKTSTGIVGLEVNPNARADLISLYNKTLDVVKMIPQEAAYRDAVESITKFRLSVVESTEDVS